MYEISDQSTGTLFSRYCRIMIELKNTWVEMAVFLILLPRSSLESAVAAQSHVRSLKPLFI